MRFLSLLFKSKQSVLTILVIICFLAIQAWCELSLPRYCSDIVNVGIAQSGISNAVPEKIRGTSLKELEMFMPDADIKTVENSYAKGEDDIYKLKVSQKDEEQINKLDGIFQTPMLILYAAKNADSSHYSFITEGTATEGAAAQTSSGAGMSMLSGAAASDSPMTGAAMTASGSTPQTASGSAIAGMSAMGGGKFDIETLGKAYETGLVTKGVLMEIRGKAENAISQLGDTMTKSASVQYVKSEYEAMNMDMQKIQTSYMMNMGLIMLLLTLASAVSSILVALFASYSAAKIARGLREGLFLRVLSFSSRELNKFTGASLITRSTNDIQQIQMGLGMSMRMVLYAPIMGIGGVMMVLTTHSGMGWIAAAVVGLLLLVVIALLYFTMPKYKMLQILIDKINLVSREILTGLPVIRAFCREKYEEKRFEDANADLMKTQLFVNRAMSMMFPALMVIMNITTVGIIWFGAKRIEAGSIQVGDMMAFITYTMQIAMAFLMISVVAIMLPRANVAAERVHEALITEPSIVDKPEGELVKRDDWQGKVVFDDVTFRYPDAEEDVLKHISFTAEPGKMTAIIGSTGSGKSTLVNLLPRLYNVTGGRITIDGVDIRDISQHDLRNILGVAPQKGILFSGDIRSNIKFGNEGMPDEHMEEAAGIAQATEFISEKDGGYESPISQGGTNVSGGQKQRLAIARAIAKDPKILIFDDSFSALDFKTDSALRRALRESVKETALIVVAQRIATIMNAERIIVLEDGEVAGMGTHKELLLSCEVYREIASGQLSEEELSA